MGEWRAPSTRYRYLLFSVFAHTDLGVIMLNLLSIISLLYPLLCNMQLKICVLLFCPTLFLFLFVILVVFFSFFYVAKQHKTTLGEAEIQSAVEAAAVIFKKVVLQRRAAKKANEEGKLILLYSTLFCVIPYFTLIEINSRYSQLRVK